MKHCPECDRNYSDVELNYCLEDGTALIYGIAGRHDPERSGRSSEAPTLLRTGDRRTVGGADAAHKPVESGRRIMSWRWGLIAVGTGAVLIAGYLMYDRRPAASTPRPIDSIAVLPFVNKSQNSDSDYLADGLAESLVYRLSQLPDLKVSPPSTVLRYKSGDIDPVRVGKELGVSAVVSGRIVEHDGNLTISVDLIDIGQNKLLWGEQYDRKMSELLNTQREIAREVVNNLKLKVSGDERGLAKQYTESSEAYQLYLKGRFYWNKRSRDGLSKAIGYFNQAIERDPGFALAYAGLADCYVVPANGLAPNDAMPKARAAAMRALELDDSLAEAHSALARVLTAYDWKWEDAEREYRRAIALSPKYAVAHQWYSSFLQIAGRPDEALVEGRIGQSLDPLSPILTFELAQRLYFLRRYDESIEEFQKALELDPNFPPALQYLPAAYEQKGMADEAIDRFQTAVSVNGGTEWSYSMGGLGHAYAVKGQKAEALKVIEDIKRLSEHQYIAKPSIALVYAGLGDKDQAIAWLEKGYEEHAFQMQSLKLEPRWDSIRSDPRFADIVRRVGLP
jgi:TolB-like protein/Tfp pilus assembly protein PilF